MKRKLVFMSLMLVVTAIVVFCVFNIKKQEINASDGKFVVFHYQRDDGNYKNWNVWSWVKGGNQLGASKMEGTDNYGAFYIVKCDKDTQKLGFSVRYSTEENEWEKKDGTEDRYVNVASVKQNIIHVYLKSGQKNFTEKVDSQLVVTSAEVYGKKKILVNLSGGKDSLVNFKFDLRDKDGKNVEVKDVEFNADYTQAYLHVENNIDFFGKYEMTNGLGVNLEVKLQDYYETKEFINNLTYDGDDLGVTVSDKKTKFRVWAPLAESLSLNLYRTGSESKDDKIQSYPMKKDKGGTWVYETPSNLSGQYYTYTIKYQEDMKDYFVRKYKIEVDDPNGYEAADPYARSAGVNGYKSMVIDPSKHPPEGWDKDKNRTVSSITDANIYEISVRDTSTDEDSGIVNKGKFVSFLERGTKTPNGTPTGMDHIVSMGVNMVQLMPIYDFASVDENEPLQNDKYNWGYDPANYNIPDGTYSTDASDGTKRVVELKDMIQEFHNEDIGVVMDVVYNHTYYAYPFGFSVLVPGYFHRPESNTSGCGNDTATERKMVRKYIVDSVEYWAKEYHIDGFRFDLMGLIDIETMQDIHDKLVVYNDEIIFYGEGWYMDSTNRTQEVFLCNQNNNRLIKFLGFFNDTIRSGLRGGNDDVSKGFVQGNKSSAQTIAYSSKGYAIWSLNEPTQLINYVSCHDNYTLWDKLYVADKNETEENLIKQNKLAAAVVQTSQGTPLFLQGEEFLRTKENAAGEKYENTYNAPDSVNKLDYSRMEEYSDVVDYYRGLVQFRKNHASLRMDKKSLVDQNYHWLENREVYKEGVVAFELDKVKGEVAENIVVIYNSNKNKETIKLPEGEWKICVNEDKAGVEPIATVSGSVDVAPISCYVLVKGETKDLSVK